MKSIIAHGGAGKSTGFKEERIDYLKEIVNNVKESEDSVDTVVNVVNKLENNPYFNAGYGSKLQLDGTPRPEAGLMKDNLSFGSVLGLDGIKNPVSVARTIMENCNNNIISAPFSTYFALQNGFKREDLRTEERISEWIEMRRELSSMKYSEIFKELREIDRGSGTVGCVGLDENNNLCAATSTGGRMYQVEGRIGDSPIPGCGFYCDDNIAISATGVGEAIMSTQLAKEVAVRHEKNTLPESVDNALYYLKKKTSGYAGIIAVNSEGESYANSNAPRMDYYRL